MSSNVIRPTLFRSPVIPNPRVTVYRRYGMQITELYSDGERLTLQLAGEMDIMSASLLTAVTTRVLELDTRSISLDLSGLRFCDCAGLRAVMQAHDALARRAGSLVLTGVPPHVRKLLSITALDQVLTVDDDVVHDTFRLGVVDELGTSVRHRRR